MAGDEMPRFHFAHRRFLDAAARLGVGAARVEATASGRIDRARHITRENDTPTRRVGIGQRHGREKRLRVGMERRREEGLAIGQLDDLAQIHHGDAVTDVLDDREIMRDEEIGETKFFLQILEQIDDLRLDRDIERGDRLVADDEARIDGQRAGDADALPLPARELMRIAFHRVGSQPDLREDSNHSILQLAARRDAVIRKRLADDRADRETRIKRGIGVLENELQFAPIRAHGARPELIDACTPELYLAGGRLDKLHDGFCRRRLPATTLADEAKGFAFPDREADAVDGGARPSLLDSFAAERSIADRHVLEVSDEVHGFVMDLIARCDGGGVPAVPPPDPVEDMASARRRSMLDISYVGSALVGQAGGVADGLSPGTRFPACHFLSGTGHHLIALGKVPRLDYLRARWDKLVSIVDASTGPFAATAAGVPNGGAILVRPDGFVGFRADPADEKTMDALDAHLATYLIPNVDASEAEVQCGGVTPARNS
jgi:hypothetical protein